MKICLAALVLLSTIVGAQSNTTAERARAWRQQHERVIFDELVAFLAIPNIATDRLNQERNAQFIAQMLARRGIAATQFAVPDGPPIVVGKLTTPGASRTITFYAHYDGAPLDPKEWATPPFAPVLRDGPLEAGGSVIALPNDASSPLNPQGRLYARGAGDDKAAIVALLSAVDALRATQGLIKSNVTFVFEGEEESGSPHLASVIAANTEMFASDLWIICDGPVYQTRQQSIIFGSRGILIMDLVVYGPRVELHSGHYGNWAPNPALALARLLSTMKDEQGHVLVDGFYDEVEPLSALERQAIAEAPAIDGALQDEFALGTTDGRPQTLNELIAMPSLNIRGMASARIGAQASGVVPSSATATLDVRVVKRMNIRRTQELIVAHIRKQGFFVVDSEPDLAARRAHPKVARVVFTRSVEARRTAMDLPISREVIGIVESVRPRAVRLPTMGGQLPLDALDPLNTPSIVIPIANHDDNQHGPNENLRLQNLWDGIDLLAALIAM